MEEANGARASEPRSSLLGGSGLPLVFLGPALVAIVIVLAPVISGRSTFFYRDISHYHLFAKWAQMQAWSQGRLPLIDMSRGGAVSIGNPNTVPFYPTNLLYAVAPFYWAFNAHFWIHLLLAPFGVYWLARVWGLRRAGASCAGVVYALSGYYLSQFGFYNLVAGAALAPALIAATLRSSRELGAVRRASGAWKPLVGMGVLWTLVLLAGDPIIALQAGVLSLLAVGVDRFRRGAAVDAAEGDVEQAAARETRNGSTKTRGHRLTAAIRGLPWLAASTLAGTLVALPQYVEMARILPYSYRFQILTPQNALLASWDPRQILEWLVPFFFGRPQLNFWGYRFSGHEVPLFFSLFPGVLAIALALVAGRPRTRGHVYAWILVVGGLAVALGSYNPLMRLVAELPGIQLLRFPIKFWLPVALGATLLVGLGFDRCREPGPRRSLLRALGLLLLLYIAFAAFLVQYPEAIESYVQSLFTQRQMPTRPHEIRMNWLAVSLLQCVLISIYAGLVAWARRAPVRAGGVALALHAASQLLLLKPLYANDAIATYREPPPLLESIGIDETVVHGEPDELFGPSDKAVVFPDGLAHWVQRRGRYELYPFVGILFGRRYELINSPEGLGSFFTVGAVQAMRLNEDDVRVRIARSAGADVLVLKRPLRDPESLGVKLRAQGSDHFTGTVWIYEVENSPPEFVLAGRVAYEQRLEKVLQTVVSPQFDPATMAVVPGPEVRQLDRPPGEVDVISSTPDRIELDARSPEGGLLVAQRVFLGLYRATVDGQPAPLTVANLHRLGLEVPAGQHRVVIWVESSPFWRSLWGVGAGAVALCCLPWLVGRRRLVAGDPAEPPEAGAGAAPEPTVEREQPAAAKEIDPDGE